jgi:glutathione S-transferase
VVTYLADKYGSNHPLGTPTPESRATLARWVLFANSTLCTDLSAKNSRSLDVMESMLADGRDYLLGDFTLADAVIAIYLGWMRYFVKCDPGFTVDRWPKVKAYKDRVLARPSAKVVDMTWIEDESQWLL